MPSSTTVSLSGNDVIDTLLQGDKWATGTLTYGFPTAASTWSAYAAGSEPFSGLTTLTAAQQSAVSSALTSWGRVANLAFSPVSEPGTMADLRFAGTSAVDTAQTYFPSDSALGGDSWYGPTMTGTATWTPGGYAYDTVVHEIGHALGLKHLHEAALGGIAASGLDTMELSVMSYRSYVGADIAAGLTVANGSYPTGPMVDDIAAIQYLYGPNWSTNAGDTVYTFTPNQGIVFGAVWDGGGTDTYDASAYTTGVNLNLGPGQWSTLSQAQLAHLNQSDPSQLARGNVANAYEYQNDPRSLIENAVGGSGADTLTGNDASNTLTGNDGADTLSGAAGADALYGNPGTDALYGNAGADALYGGQAGDQLFGGQDGDLLYGNLGDDLIFGNLGNDTLYGGQGADQLYGGQGDDVLFGNAGDDTLVGGAGADRFISGGNDVVADFHLAEGDRIRIAAGTTWTVVSAGGNAEVDLSDGHKLTLAGVAPGAVDAGYFVTV